MMNLEYYKYQIVSWIFLIVFIEDENDSDQEEEDEDKEEAPSVDKRMSRSNSQRASKLGTIQRQSSLSSTKVSWKGSIESVHIVCQTCTESNATADSGREKDICLHKPNLYISNGDEADEKETAVWSPCQKNRI